MTDEFTSILLDVLAASAFMLLWQKLRKELKF